MIEIDTRPAVTPETTTPMKPSEAMRLGRMLYPTPCEGQLAAPYDGGWAVCAKGAMYVGYGWTPGTLAAPSYSPVLEAKNADCPACSLLGGAADVTTHLNDAHHWPTECIADWLEGLGL